jgi:D-glycero-alpha-D-manno-heptose-7-phosphate kinase
MIITKTPFRLSLFGGGTDFPEYIDRSRHGGLVVGTAIDKHIYISINKFFHRLFSYRLRLSYSITEKVIDANHLKHPSARAILNEFGVNDGVEITATADLPASTGLGSSSAFAVGLINAVSHHLGVSLGSHELADRAVRVERILCMEPGGYQDQYLSSFGGIRSIRFSKDKAPHVSAPLIGQSDLEQLFGSFLCFFTGVQRSAADIEGQKVQSMDANMPLLNKLYELALLGESVIRRKDSIESIGKLLNESWALKRGLSDKVSNDDIDLLYKSALEAGCFGGKLLGAGGGGFFLVVCNPVNTQRVRNALSHLIEVPILPSAQGSHVVHASV